MPRYSLSHLADSTLLRDLATLVARDRTTTAELLAHLAEVDARKLYLPAAYPSMFAYCVHELHLSEDAASKRIQAARAARRFPAIFDCLADGRLHLSAVVLLVPHLSESTADELPTAATHKSKAEIEQLLAARFPQPGLPAWVTAIPGSSVSVPAGQHAPGHVVNQVAQGPLNGQLAPEPVTDSHAPVQAAERSRVKPVGPRGFTVQFTMSQSAHDKLRHAQTCSVTRCRPGSSRRSSSARSTH